MTSLAPPVAPPAQPRYNFYPGFNTNAIADAEKGPAIGMVPMTSRGFGTVFTRDFPGYMDANVLDASFPWPSASRTTETLRAEAARDKKATQALANRPAGLPKQTPVDVLLSPYSPPNTAQFQNTMSSARKLMPLLTRQQQADLAADNLNSRSPRVDSKGNVVPLRSTEWFVSAIDPGSADSIELLRNAGMNALRAFQGLSAEDRKQLKALVQTLGVSSLARKTKSHWGDCAFAVQNWITRNWEFYPPNADGWQRALGIQSVFVPIHALKLWPALQGIQLSTRALVPQPKQRTYTYFLEADGSYGYRPIDTVQQTARTTARRAAVKAADNANAFDRFALSWCINQLMRLNRVDDNFVRVCYDEARNMYRTLHGDVGKVRKIQSEAYAKPRRDNALFMSPVGTWRREDWKTDAKDPIAGAPPRTAVPAILESAPYWDTLYANRDYGDIPLPVNELKTRAEASATAVAQRQQAAQVAAQQRRQRALAAAALAQSTGQPQPRTGSVWA